MNTKRQTIWLVSMLSLMVVLSAYYLFTNDIGDDLLSDAGEHIAQDGNATEASGEGGVIIDEVQVGSAPGTALTDEERALLEEFEAQNVLAGGNDYFTRQQFTRFESLAKQVDQLNAILANTTTYNSDEAQQALEELYQLEDKEEKIANLELELQKDFQNAVIAESDNHFKIVVQSENMERSQAAGILERVMNALGVSANQVSVQFLP